MPTTRKSTTTPSLKQATLGFQSAKRSGSIATGKARRTRSTPVEEVTTVESSSDDPLDDIELSLSEDEQEDEPKVTVTKDEKKAKTAKKPATTKVSGRSLSLTTTPTANKSTPAPVKPELDVKAAKWNMAFKAARIKSGNLEPIHSAGLNRIHEVLRVFDMSYEYGPCVGIPRMDRWNRAQALGLNPPQEVHDILITREGSEKREYSESAVDNIFAAMHCA